jgi:4-amino-4-deoxy-L-arabinose transferase-like glycosyltransferase
VFLTTPEIVLLGRFCNIDASLTLCISVATFSLLTWAEPPHRTPWASYGAMGLGMLLKGPVAIVLPLLVTGATLVSRRRLPPLRTARPLTGLVIVAALVIPWLVLTHAVDPRYLTTFLIEHNVRRYTSPQFDHVEGPFFFAPVLLAVFFPWSLLLPAVLAGQGDPDDRRRSWERDMLLWVLVVVGFFSFGHAKLATYVAPAMPALALWMGARLDRVLSIDRPRDGWLRFALAAWAVALVSLAVGSATFVGLEHPRFFPAAAWSLALPLLAALGVSMAWRKLRMDRVILVFAATNAALFLIFYLLAAPIVARVASDHSLARLVARLAPDVEAAGFRVQPASFSFYSTRTASQVDVPAEIDLQLRNGPLLILTRRKYLPQLLESGHELHEWADNGRHVLLATFPRPGRPRAAGPSVARQAPR